MIRIDTRDPRYRAYYERGWRAGQRGADGALDRADARREPNAWYDGYLDAAAGRAKWAWRDARRAGFSSPEAYARALAAESAQSVS